MNSGSGRIVWRDLPHNFHHINSRLHRLAILLSGKAEVYGKMAKSFRSSWAISPAEGRQRRPEMSRH
ncbi:hypothetical protein J6590_003058 [Homalodisca vitripennis]|nr:hypothetical protein J6590_003058 [Homalodisca vitripennis]